MKRTFMFCVLIAGTMGCGARSGPEGEKCLDDCRMEFMQCLEALDCSTVDGQPIPCEENCRADQAKCESDC